MTGRQVIAVSEQWTMGPGVAAIVISAINTAGYLMALWIKYHWKVIETPTRMQEVDIKSKCRMLEDKALKQCIDALGENYVSGNRAVNGRPEREAGPDQAKGQGFGSQSR